MTDKADNDALVQRVEYILDMTASAKERMHRRMHLTNHDLRTIRAALRTPQPAPVVDGPLAGKVERPYAFCCAEGGGDPKFCDCVNKNHGTAWFDAPKATRRQPDETETLRAEVARLREALGVADAAIKEMFRYYDGGETRGSYDGKPERNQLRKAGYATTAALKGTDHGRG